MYRFIHTIGALLLFCGIASAQETFSLDGTWSFALQAPDGPVPTKLDKTIAVPSCWAVQGFEEPVYRGFKDDKAATGYYGRSFELPEVWSGKRVLLHFDGVWACAYPTLNGHELGSHDSGYTSFAYDVTNYLTSGTNELRVKVVQASRSYKFDTNDDWSMGGIYRDVWLESMPRKHWLEKPTVVTAFDKKYKDADLEVKIFVCDDHKNKVPGNFPSPEPDFELVYTLTGPDGSQVFKHVETVEGQGSTDKEIVKNFKVKAPLKWNAEHPNLYGLTIDLVEDGKVTHSRSEHVGFRQVKIEDGVFLLNGTPIKLRGVNRHDEHPDVGRATRREHWLHDLTMMKDANINYIRLSHYTPAQGFIDLCDSLGMYVSNEISLGGAGSNLHRDPSYMDAALLRTYETVSRDLNAPSIVFWTVGNEDALTTMHLVSAKLIKSLDGTRPMAIPWRSENWMPEEFEILAPHYWQPAQYDSLATVSTRPIVSTEYTHAYGTHATGGLAARWEALTKHANGTGAAVWMWQDQGIKTPVPPKKQSSLSDDPFLRLDGQGWDGIVDSYRHPTRDLEEVKAVYAQVYPLTDKVKAAGRVRIPIRNDFDFTNLNEVSIKWEQYADSTLLTGGDARISAPAHSAKRLKLKLAPATGIYANYLILKFLREDGSEITRRSIELTTNGRYVAEDYTRYIDPLTIMSSLRPVIWHKLDDTEKSMYSKDERRLLSSLNLGKYEMQNISGDDRTEGGVDIYDSKIKFVIDSLNSFIGDFEFRVTDREIAVKYSLEPHVQLSWIPVYGMAFNIEGLKDLKWVGPGPQNAYPNKRSAPIFGLWDYTSGIKATDTILCNIWEGILRIDSQGYMEVDADNPNTILILEEVVSRPEKGRKAVEPFPLLKTDTGKPFEGSFTISFK